MQGGTGIIRRWRAVTLIGVAVIATLAAGLTAAFAATPGRTDAAASPRFYVSLGDSYAIGYQPGRGVTRNGYADQVVAKAAGRGYRLRLVNYGCGGATTTSILQATSCPAGARARGGPDTAGLTQAAAAEAFLRAHAGKVALVTVSIGGNDVTMCAASRDPVGCVLQATASIKANITRLATELRAAAGPNVPIVGTTYPDVILGQWVHPPVSRNLAQLSVTAFRSLINPTLRQSYAAAQGRFVDVTAATGAYVPFAKMVRLAPYGVIPTAVARACTYSYYCKVGDIHATTAGYGVIAALIVGTLPRV